MDGSEDGLFRVLQEEIFKYFKTCESFSDSLWMTLIIFIPLSSDPDVADRGWQIP